MLDLLKAWEVEFGSATPTMFYVPMAVQVNKAVMIDLAKMQNVGTWITQHCGLPTSEPTPLTRISFDHESPESFLCRMTASLPHPAT